MCLSDRYDERSLHNYNELSEYLLLTGNLRTSLLFGFIAILPKSIPITSIATKNIIHHINP